MARLIRRDYSKPHALEIGGEKKWICMCGLSGNLPFCDGSHKLTLGEEAGKLYEYDEQKRRKEVK